MMVSGRSHTSSTANANWCRAAATGTSRFSRCATKSREASKVKNAVLDGEIVVLDQQGRSVFNKMLFRRGDPMLYVFDLLWLDNRDLRTKPLIERKRDVAETDSQSRSVIACYLRSTLNVKA